MSKMRYMTRPKQIKAYQFKSNTKLKDLPKWVQDLTMGHCTRRETGVTEELYMSTNNKSGPALWGSYIVSSNDGYCYVLSEEDFKDQFDIHDDSLTSIKCYECQGTGSV